MSDIHPVLRLFEAWGAAASAERYRIVCEVTPEGFYFADPNSGPLQGRAAFLGYLTTVKTRLPDGAIEATGPVEEHEGHLKVPFAITRAGQPVRKGTFFGDLDPDGLVERLVGFLE